LDLTYEGEKKFGPARVVAKFPMTRIDALGPINMDRRVWRSELAGYRDIPVNTLAIHRASAYFAQGPCLIMQALAPEEGHANQPRGQGHAEVALRGLAQMHAMYWGYSPTFNLDFMLDHRGAMVPYIRHMVAPGLRAAGELVPASWPALEPYVAALETKMDHIADAYLYPPGAALTLGLADFKFGNLRFKYNGEQPMDIQNSTDFQPMWAHPMTDVAGFVVRSFEPEERKKIEKELVQCYHQAVLAVGISQTEFPFEQCWEGYTNRVAHYSGCTVALVALRLARQKQEGILDEGCTQFKHLVEWTTRLAAAIQDHGLAAKFAALDDDGL